MKRDFSDLGQTTFDLIVIGGGIIGTGIARDAALRGLETLLVEKEDLAAGTTARSTRLIHGGLRYLRRLELKLVRQDLREREILLHIAPHLVHRLEFAIPLLRHKPLYRIALPAGLCLYDLMAAGKSLPSRHHLSRREILQIEPALGDTAGLVGGYLFYDCQAPDMERLCVENALAAAAKGARILNHCAARGFLQAADTVRGVRLQDTLTGEHYTARGRLVLNAGGPWADRIFNTLDPPRRINLRLTRGVHLLARRITGHALVLFVHRDGRLFFCLPWGENSLIGTTDTDYTGDPENVSATRADVDYLVNATREYFPRFGVDDIYYATAGLRPLVPGSGKTTGNLSRAHRLIDHARRDNLDGLVSVLGGKITAYRAIAEEAVDLACRKLGVQTRCQTAGTLLPGAPAPASGEQEKLAQTEGLPVEAIHRLAGLYGRRLSRVLEYFHPERDAGGPNAEAPLLLRAEIEYAVREEAALTVSDFLLRRNLLGLAPGQGLPDAEAIAAVMGQLLGWSLDETRHQTAAYRAAIALTRSFRPSVANEAHT